MRRYLARQDDPGDNAAGRCPCFNPGGWDNQHQHFQHKRFFAMPKDVPGEEMATLSGDLITRVLEGPYRRVRV